MKSSHLIVPPAGPRHGAPCGTPGGAVVPARETSRMRSGHLPTRPVRRLTPAFTGAALGLILLAGCDSNGYDASLTYPVRGDWIVSPAHNWEQQPTTFNRPAILPLDALRLPEHEQPEYVKKLKGEVGKK